VVGIDPLYFLDEMSQDETVSIMKAKVESDKQAWEQTRMLCFYSVVSQNGTKQFKKPKDLFTFSWDDKDPDKGRPKGKRLTKEEAEAKVAQNKGLGGTIYS